MNRINIKKSHLGCLTALLTLTGCLFDPNTYLAERHSSILMQGNSVHYANGYVDGCATGRNEAGDSYFHFQKNNHLVSKSRDYASGWADGRKSCKKEYLNRLENNRKEEKMNYYRAKQRTLEEQRWERWRKN